MGISVYERAWNLLGRLRSRLEAHRFWLRLTAVTALVVVPAILVGRSGRERADALHAEHDRLERLAGETESRLRRFQPASEAERRAWRESERALDAVALRPGGQVAIAQQLAQRAEEAGIRRLEIHFEQADTLETPMVQVGSHTFAGSPVAISTEFTSGYREVVELFGALPPQVETHGLRMEREEGGIRTRLLLGTYRIATEGSDAGLP